ncbi:hypothetical protein PACTADRAFT_50719 [Pachysolen tannophilus NRRL Y-2460]|uniref:Aminopeptidase n=1 Tax=Pachysolen tannophilus NRRL Y-2460 TaxID=669874 RepID=A0A1E4TSY8_PACTA|nr:hypothetical protein PACTADRAFT_50719 [Pachysolen tannophilus NRRL Y-2460]
MSSTTVTTDRQVLPTNVKPTKYNVILDPNFQTFTYEGEITIDFNVNDKKSDFISLNTLELELHETKILGKDLAPIETTYDKDSETTTFKFDTPLEDDKLQLYIKFSGILNDKMCGFYRSSYELNGEKKYIASTQMESTDCRRAFPSYDEPSAKAVFDITLIADKKFTCLSNMDVKDTINLPNDRKKVVFNTTPLMSTYLVAFVIGEFGYIESNDYKVPIRVYTTPGSEEKGRFALETAVEALNFYDKKFGINYPLPKLDMVAIPDFSAGAMENFGLITYRVVLILYDEKTSTPSAKQRVGEVVAHELAHQWFGNLVTMDWWEGLWLNEGFATWVSWYFLNYRYPEWKVWEQYVGDSLQSALGLDGLRSSHPVEVPIQRHDQISQIFDSISYAKGSCVLKMIANWLGEDVFIKGVAKYLEKHAWGNTKTSDLWESLSEVSGEDVVKVMNIWTKHVGYPILTVNENNNEIKIQQNRYLATHDVKPEEDELLYTVFLALKTKDKIDESLILDTRSTSLTLEDPSFYKLNANQTGIYRTLYTPERWAKLGVSGTQGLLSAEDRTGLVADAGALASSGYASTENLFSLVNNWKNESSFTVWNEILSRINAVKNAFIFEPQEVQDALQDFTRSLVSVKLKEVGWELHAADSFLDQRLKGLLFGAATKSGDPTALKAAQAMFDKYVAGDKEAIPVNLRDQVFGAVAKLSSDDYYDNLLSIFKNPSSPDEGIAALRALGSFEKPELIKRTLSYLLDGTVRTQDIYVPMVTLASQKNGIELLFQWLTENLEAITKALSVNILAMVVSICTRGFTSREQKNRVQEFFKNQDTKGYDQSLAQMLDVIQTKISWVERDSENVKKWLSQNGFMK